MDATAEIQKACSDKKKHINIAH